MDAVEKFDNWCIWYRWLFTVMMSASECEFFVGKRKNYSEHWCGGFVSWFALVSRAYDQLI